MKNPFRNNVIKSQTAFTLVELMVVIGIIAIMSAIAIPNLMNPEHKLKKAATGLMADMQRTRSMAIKENKEWRIVFDASGYSITTDTPPVTKKRVDLSGYAAGVKYGRASASEVTDAEDLSDSTKDSKSILTFDSRGRCNIGVEDYGHGVIYLQYGDVTYAVVSGSTGNIRLLRWDGGDWK